MVLVRSVRMLTWTDLGSVEVSCGSSALMRSTTAMMLAPGCRWMFMITAGTLFIQAAWRMFSASSITRGHVGQLDRRAVAVGDHQRRVVGAGEQLVVGADLVGLVRAVEAALGLVDVGGDDGAAQVLQVQAVGSQHGGVGLNAHRRLLAAADAHQADARQLRNLGRQARIRQVFHLGQRHGVGVSASVRMGVSAGLVLL